MGIDTCVVRQDALIAVEEAVKENRPLPEDTKYDPAMLAESTFLEPRPPPAADNTSTGDEGSNRGPSQSPSPPEDVFPIDDIPDPSPPNEGHGGIVQPGHGNPVLPEVNQLPQGDGNLAGQGNVVQPPPEGTPSSTRSSSPRGDESIDDGIFGPIDDL
jgi:hypothetical protein